ncbi:MAG: hydroxyethylthiazole kinase [Lachnospiraceae bacterium]|nr:hydroxyethylthiazole kinase [Lachnospiraceae bacterium]
MNHIRISKPLIHMITNDVSRESCVNIVLAAGGTAICAEGIEEVQEIVDLAEGLLINIGMSSEKKGKAMEMALLRAKERAIPVVLDPVGVGASEFRRNLVQRLLDIGGITCIRGNAGEIATLCHLSVASRGVETGDVHATVEQVQQLSTENDAIVMVSGEQDLLVWKNQVICKAGGGEVFTRMTGSGCMQSALLAASIAASIDPWQGVQEGVALFDAAGAIARTTMRGMGSFAVDFMDAISNS